MIWGCTPCYTSQYDTGSRLLQMESTPAPPLGPNAQEHELPASQCQLRITFASHSTPLLWICTKRDRKTICAVINRWSESRNIKEQLARLTPPPSTEHQLLYTVPPKNIPQFPSQLAKEISYDTKKQDIHIIFAYYPPFRCSFCGEVGPQLPQIICNWCQTSPTFHHHHCCPHVNLEIREKLLKKRQRQEDDLEDDPMYANVPPRTGIDDTPG